MSQRFHESAVHFFIRMGFDDMTSKRSFSQFYLQRNIPEESPSLHPTVQTVLQRWWAVQAGLQPNAGRMKHFLIPLFITVQSISSKRRLFDSGRPLQGWLYLEEAEGECCDLMLHMEIRFRDLLPDAKSFLPIFNHREYTQLDDKQWLSELAFRTMPNDLNVELHGRDKRVVDMIRTQLPKHVIGAGRAGDVLHAAEQWTVQ